MKNNFENHRFRSLLWIVNQLKGGPKSLRELNERWVRDEGLSGGMPIERRTFNNYVHAIDDLFHISIECDKKNKFRYSIVEEERNALVNWMQKNFRQQLILERGLNLKGRILLEDVPKGQEILAGLLEAMRQNKLVRIIFRDFNYEGEIEFIGAPYTLKLYQQRWYIVLKNKEDEEMDVLSLDRIREMETLDEHFIMDPTFNGEEFFRYSFGVRVIHDEQPQKIIMKVKQVQCGYLRTLPLYHSQKEIERHKEYSIFELTLVPTIELTMKILSMGFLVEVLSPDSLKTVIAKEAERVYNIYYND